MIILRSFRGKKTAQKRTKISSILVHRALWTLFIDYENTFEVKTGKGHCKLSFETKNVKIGSYLGSPGAKNFSKKGPKFHKS